MSTELLRKYANIVAEGETQALVESIENAQKYLFRNINTQKPIENIMKFANPDDAEDALFDAVLAIKTAISKTQGQLTPDVARQYVDLFKNFDDDAQGPGVDAWLRVAGTYGNDPDALLVKNAIAEYRNGNPGPLKAYITKLTNVGHDLTAKATKQSFSGWSGAISPANSRG